MTYKKTTLRLRPTEIKSNHDRQKFAEGLILQLPAEHDGRNTWLLNYGEGKEAKALRVKNNIAFIEHYRAAAWKS